MDLFTKRAQTAEKIFNMAKGRIKRPEKAAEQSFKLPRVGQIKTGFKNASNYPQSCDYFIPAGKYAGLFKQAYGDKPDTVQIVFWEDTPETMCNERYELRDKDGKLYARGDGEDFEIWSVADAEYKNYSVTEYPDLMERTKKKVGKEWEVILTLRFILPKVKDIAGYWEYSTKGEASTIPAIRDTFDIMMQSRGSVRGVIFDLTVKFAKSQKPGVKSRYPVVSLVPNQSKENVEAVKGAMYVVPNDIKQIGAVNE